MDLKSSFKSDLNKEQKLSTLLDECYKNYLKNYTYKRIHDLKSQLMGIDIIFTHKSSGNSFYIDEKAQLDYINDDLPTFAFELQYEKGGFLKKGWLFDENKSTNFYSLITGIYSDEPEKFTSCKITFVNREKLIELLSNKGINNSSLSAYIESNTAQNGKLIIDELNSKNEGYLFFSSSNKKEKPVNLILKLEFLLNENVGKRFC
ncbi:hypothetical protein GGR42_001921 [Saonia flava]|uniref:Uncharacterized protein n=1 Tax=Saonia flava TaxID=523696 RepID=A0A846R3R6_9FLAO|nr:hypothetical protein [Saonia flava]NJB71459.1 hypothetical protein [Saonia flava]